MPDQAGGGLGGWIKWLRDHPAATISEIREALAVDTSRKTWYLEFSTIQPPDKARAFLPVLGSDPQADYEQMKQWVGKRIRVRGMVDGEILGPRRTRFPKVLVKSRDALEVLE